MKKIVARREGGQKTSIWSLIKFHIIFNITFVGEKLLKAQVLLKIKSLFYAHLQKSRELRWKRVSTYSFI